MQRKTRLWTVLGLVVLAGSMVGCDQESTLVGTETESVDGAGKVTAQATASICSDADPLVANNRVHYNGRSYDETQDQTSFSYTVCNESTSASNYVIVEVLTCALPQLIAVDPGQSAKVGADAKSGLQGVKWEASVPQGQARTYRLTFAGEIAERTGGAGPGNVAIESGNLLAYGQVAGPACPVYTISGQVFSDIDEDGSVDAGEIGLANVVVRLRDAQSEAILSTQTTDAAGRYVFTGASGAYRVTIDQAAGTAANLNDHLFTDWTFTGPASWTAGPAGTPTSITRDVTVGPDAVVDPAGFKLQAKKLVAEIDGALLSTTGLSRKEWIRILRSAVKGRPAASEPDAATLLAALAWIEAQELPVPYQFEDGNELDAVLAILTTNCRQDIACELFSEALAFELNTYFGLGLADQDHQRSMFAYVEGVIVQSGYGTAAKQGAGPIAVGIAGLADTEDALNLVKAIGGGGGGGVGN